MWMWEQVQIASPITAINGKWEWVRVYRPTRKQINVSN